MSEGQKVEQGPQILSKCPPRLLSFKHKSWNYFHLYSRFAIWQKPSPSSVNSRKELAGQARVLFYPIPMVRVWSVMTGPGWEETERSTAWSNWEMNLEECVDWLEVETLWRTLNSGTSISWDDGATHWEGECWERSWEEYCESVLDTCIRVVCEGTQLRCPSM